MWKKEKTNKEIAKDVFKSLEDNFEKDTNNNGI